MGSDVRLIWVEYSVTVTYDESAVILLESNEWANTVLSQINSVIIPMMIRAAVWQFGLATMSLDSYLFDSHIAIRTV
jgi:hypothetical protein